jgi:hypothetical protein
MGHVTLDLHSLHTRSEGLISPNKVSIRHEVSDGKEGRIHNKACDKSRDTELPPT